MTLEVVFPLPVSYVHLTAGEKPVGTLPAAPFIAVIVGTRSVEAGWRPTVSHWLVENRCLYACSWGVDAEAWHDSVDLANLEVDDFNVSEASHVMTTCHDGDSLDEVFWFAGHAAHHGVITLEHVLIVDISPEAREADMLSRCAQAQTLDDEA
ncbi:DUF7684 family protein [Brevundimonas sp.]|uniref:DUF7684 family protein n=1 Tax=Brevundimonas sp. TaxID=1871086 RepID=UPI003AF5ADB6